MSQVQSYMYRERRRDPARRFKKISKDDIVFAESVLPLSVYNELGGHFVETDFNVLPVTVWRWKKFVIAFDEEPVFGMDRVLMTTDQTDRMMADWDIDVSTNWMLFRSTVYHLIESGNTHRGNLYEYTRLLGFRVTKSKVTCLLDNLRRKKKPIESLEELDRDK